MNAKQAKNIILSDYLTSLGHTPCSQQGDHLWYKSPFREEYHPSFKVSRSKNLWYDFGMGKGGNLIDFAMEYYKIKDLSHLLKTIEERTPTLKSVSFSFDKQNKIPSFEEMKVRPLSNPALLSYLIERKINPNIASGYCHEVYYKRNEKWYFALAFKNQSEGYELRNKYYKGSIAPKDITHIPQNGKECLLFEGFIDFLSFLTLKEKSATDTGKDYLILNSLSNLNKAIHILKEYKNISCYLDNDRAGKEAVEQLKSNIPVSISDQSVHYANFKDLNDFLLDRSKTQSEKRIQHPPKNRGQKPKF